MSSGGALVSPRQKLDNMAGQLAGCMESYGSTVAQLLPKGYSHKRLVAMFYTAARDTPKLIDCDPNSMIKCMFASAILGLDPNTPKGECYLIPYKREATFVLGYQGALTLARRAGVRKVWSRAVYANEEFSVSFGTDEGIHHVPIMNGDRGPLCMAYAIAILESGETQFEVLDASDIKGIRATSASAGSSGSPWNKWEARMWEKSAIKRLCKRLALPDMVSMAMEDDVRGEMGKAPKHLVPEIVDAQAKEAERPTAVTQVVRSPEGHQVSDDPAKTIHSYECQACSEIFHLKGGRRLKEGERVCSGCKEESQGLSDANREPGSDDDWEPGPPPEGEG